MTDQHRFHELFPPKKKPSSGQIAQLLEDPYGAIRGRRGRRSSTSGRRSSRAAKRGWSTIRNSTAFFLEFLEYVNRLADKNPKEAKVPAIIAVRLAFRRLSRLAGNCFPVRALCALSTIIVAFAEYDKAKKIIEWARSLAAECPMCRGMVFIEEARCYGNWGHAEERSAYFDQAVKSARQARAIFSAQSEPWQEGKAAILLATALYDTGRHREAIATAKEALHLVSPDSRHFIPALHNYVRMLVMRRQISEARAIMPFLWSAVKEVAGLHRNKEWVRWLEAVLIVLEKNCAVTRFRARRRLETSRRNFATMGMGLEVALMSVDIAVILYPDRKAIQTIIADCLDIVEVRIALQDREVLGLAEDVLKACAVKVDVTKLPAGALRGKCSLIDAVDWDPTGEVGKALGVFRSALKIPNPLKLGPEVMSYPKNSDYTPRSLNFKPRDRRA